MRMLRVPAMSVLLAAVYIQPARAQEPADYPSKPIHILVGFTPGGGPDITARYVAQKLGEAWKQQVIVDNRPGAGGTLAAGMVARAVPDGATLLSVSSAHAIAPILYSNLSYDTFKDLSGITLSAASKYVLVVSPSLGIKSVRELIARARAKPGSLNFSSAGVGSGTHFAGEMFKAMAAIDVVHVPFKGIPEALTETLTARVQFFMAPIANAVGQVKEGKLAGLGVSSAERDPLLPEVPTIAEAGVPGYESILWFGLLSSSAVPRPVIAKLNREIVRVESTSGVRLGEVSTQDQSRTAASNARESAIEDKIQALKDRQAVLEVDARSAQMAADYISRLGAPSPGTEKPAPALSGKSVAEVIEAVRRGGSDAFGRIQKVQVQKRELDKEIRALERDLARLKSGAKDVRTIAIGVSAEGPGEVRVSYQVNGAGWRPAYRAGLDSAGSKVLLERQGAISQVTGEDWTNVKLKLSTGQPRLSPQGAEPRPWRLSLLSPTADRLSDRASGVRAAT